VPDADVTISEAGPPKALAKLRKGDVDLAVAFRRLGSAAPEGVDERMLLEESMYAVIPRRHPLAGEPEIELAGLRDDAWVQGPSATSPGLIRELCREAGFEPRIAFESDEYQVLQGYVAAGLGFTLLPDLALPALHPDLVVRPTDPTAPERRVWAATRSKGARSAATEAMVEILRQIGQRFADQSALAIAA
jgi:DNA-binding transcriptional LysR family regulator